MDERLRFVARVMEGEKVAVLSTALAGQDVGIKQVDERLWQVTFMTYDLGFFDHQAGRVESAFNPFEAKVSPMSPE